jgi:hypothetical protein
VSAVQDAEQAALQRRVIDTLHARLRTYALQWRGTHVAVDSPFREGGARASKWVLAFGDVSDALRFAFSSQYALLFETWDPELVPLFPRVARGADGRVVFSGPHVSMLVHTLSDALLNAPPLAPVRTSSLTAAVSRAPSAQSSPSHSATCVSPSALSTLAHPCCAPLSARAGSGAAASNRANRPQPRSPHNSMQDPPLGGLPDAAAPASGDQEASNSVSTRPSAPALARAESGVPIWFGTKDLSREVPWCPSADAGQLHSSDVVSSEHLHDGGTGGGGSAQAYAPTAALLETPHAARMSHAGSNAATLGYAGDDPGDVQLAALPGAANGPGRLPMSALQPSTLSSSHLAWLQVRFALLMRQQHVRQGVVGPSKCQDSDKNMHRAVPDR